MIKNSRGFQGKLLTIILSIIFLALVVLVSTTFFIPKEKINHQSKIIEQPIDNVWKSISNPKYYLDSKKEIEKYTIYDSINPKWTEFYTSNDSVENITKSTIYHKKITYLSINRKFEQINGFSFRLDSLSENQTKVDCYELSRYFNVWASVYFQLFHPNLVIDYEFIKINNTIQYIDSVSKI